MQDSMGILVFSNLLYGVTMETNKVQHVFHLNSISGAFEWCRVTMETVGSNCFWRVVLLCQHAELQSNSNSV